MELKFKQLQFADLVAASENIQGKPSLRRSGRPEFNANKRVMKAAIAGGNTEDFPPNPIASALSFMLPKLREGKIQSEIGPIPLNFEEIQHCSASIAPEPLQPYLWFSGASMGTILIPKWEKIIRSFLTKQQTPGSHLVLIMAHLCPPPMGDEVSKSDRILMHGTRKVHSDNASDEQ
ncbi:MAG: hypothetical protein LBT57_00385 [Puniceicoccales bacterium]|nr:hypothetical protein [Puniceicoccales bacterium]